MRNPFHILAHMAGYQLLPREEKVTKDMDPAFRPIFELSRDYTLTTRDQLYTLFEAVQYIENAHIPGDVVECGTWKGGSSMALAGTLSYLGTVDRALYLYDTFTGMPEPDARDVKIRTHEDGRALWKEKSTTTDGWWAATEDEVRTNVEKTGYPTHNIITVAGKVEETIPQSAPETISILRLDTDWYASTYHELVHLFPRVSHGGIVIIDDYGSWAGAREATDTYFRATQTHPFLIRIGNARVMMKI